MQQKDNANVHEAVSRAYAHAVTQPPDAGCCGGGTVQKGVAAKVAGYTREELDALPPDAVVNSFGCGNPLALSEVREGDVVLDLGSGAGIDILLAGKKVGPTGRAIGIDMTDEMIARASENIQASGLKNVEVRKGIIEDLPVDSGTVDWVISNCVINLSPDKPKVFAEIARVLKPGGRMRVSDIVADELPAAVRQSRAFYCTCVAGAISEDQYRQGLKDKGLKDVTVVERFIYDATQLKAFVGSELAAGEAGTGCCSAPAGDDDAIALATSLVGKVWSAKFTARKPDQSKLYPIVAAGGAFPQMGTTLKRRNDWTDNAIPIGIDRSINHK